MSGHSLWGSMTLGKGQLGHYPLASSSPWAATAMPADGSLQPWDAHGPLSTNVHDTLPMTLSILTLLIELTQSMLCLCRSVNNTGNG